MPKAALVTGGTSGIGKEVARELSVRGYSVYTTGRSAEELPAEERLPGVKYVNLDLSDPESIAECAAKVGDVEVLIHNAGESQSGPFEELPLDALERLFRTNVHGAVLLTQHFLPGMRARGSGRVVMVGSMLASFPLAFRGSYVAAKAAIKSFGLTARMELEPYGVQVSVVEPGSIATGIGTRRTSYIAQHSEYKQRYETMLEHLNANERAGIKPIKVARLVANAVAAPKTKPFYAIGSGAPGVFFAKRLLPPSLIEKMVLKRHGIS